MPNKIVNFKQLLNRLYAIDPNDENIFVLNRQEYQFMNTREENMKCPISRQQNLAKKVQELYKAMGTTTVDDLKAMIRMNLINNNEVATDNVNLDTKAYGPDVG